MAKKNDGSGSFRTREKYQPKFGNRSQSEQARQEMIERAIGQIEKAAAREKEHPNTIAPEILDIARERPGEAFGIITAEGEHMVFLPTNMAKPLMEASTRLLTGMMAGHVLGEQNGQGDQEQDTPGNSASGSTRRSDRRAGFTMPELLVTMAIIGILVGLTVPAVMKARESARQLQWKNNLRQVGIATQSFHTDHGYYPYAVSYENGAGGVLVPHSWVVDLLPYLEQNALYNQYDRTKNPEDQSIEIKNAIIPILNHPSFQEAPGRMHIGALSTTGNIATDPNFLNNPDMTGLKYYNSFRADYDVVMPPQRAMDPITGKVLENSPTRMIRDGASNTVTHATHAHKEGNRDPWLAGKSHITGHMWGTDLGTSHVVGGVLGNTEVDNNFVASHVMPHNGYQHDYNTVLFADGSVRNVKAFRPYSSDAQKWKGAVTKSGGEVGTPDF